MKKLFLIFFILPLCFKAQVYKAGDSLAAYFDINPDTTMDCSSAYFNRFIYLDVNNDSQKDFLIRSDGFNGALGGATNTNYVSIFPLDINGFIRYGRKDSVYNSYTGHWQYGEFAKPLHLGDTINLQPTEWRNQGLAIINKSGQFGTYLNTQDWMGGTDLYIGIKYLDITDTVYGWIRVNCPAFYTCILKDYSFSKCVNSTSLTLASSSNSICASETATISAMGATTYTWSTGETNHEIVVSPGITTTYTVDGNSNGCLGNSVITLIVDPCVGIKEYDLSYLKIYPNPTINNLNITNENNSFENSTIEIINYLSQTIFKQSYSNTIDVSQLPAGIYTLKIQSSGKSILYSKFIKD